VARVPSLRWTDEGVVSLDKRDWKIPLARNTNSGHRLGKYPTLSQKEDCERMNTRKACPRFRNLCDYLWPPDPLGESGREEGSQGAFLQPILCLRCRREIEAGDKSVAVYMFAQTVGVRPRQKSSANRICFCPQCAVSLAMGLPPEGALNMAAWDMIRELVSGDPSLNQAAWEGLRGIVGLLAEGQVEGRCRRAV
jgi:hypothetical protein